MSAHAAQEPGESPLPDRFQLRGVYFIRSSCGLTCLGNSLDKKGSELVRVRLEPVGVFLSHGSCSEVLELF